MAVGGAAYLVVEGDQAGAQVVGFADLGMEAIYEFEVKDMPVTVAVDSSGTSVHETGPAEWQARIAKIPVAGGVKRRKVVGRSADGRPGSALTTATARGSGGRSSAAPRRRAARS